MDKRSKLTRASSSVDQSTTSRRRVPNQSTAGGWWEKHCGGRWFESILAYRFKFRWCERVSNHSEECHYLTRTVLETPWFSIRLHHWLKSDDQRFPHDHPWWFFSLVLWGSYWDLTEHSATLRKWMTVCYYPHTHKHKVKVSRPCWTLLLTGLVKHRWGFFVDGEFVPKKEYFKKWGHHEC